MTPMGESANVNPSLTTVTWTADESKTSNGNGTIEEKEPLKDDEETKE